MSKKILFVVEGGRTETNFLISSFVNALNLSSEKFEVCKYRANIHKLFKRMKKNGYDSFLSFLYSIDKNIFPKDMFTPETAFSSVYLIFDLDPQDELFSIEETKEIALFFDDETVNGKLYINYPMVESIFDFSTYDSKLYNKKTYPIYMLSSNYKNDARANSFLTAKYKTCSFRKIQMNDIYSICIMNMKKYAYLCHDEFEEKWKNGYSPIRSLLAEIPYLEKGIVSILNCGILLIPDYNPSLLQPLKKIS